MDRSSTRGRTASGLQQIVREFVTRLRWTVEELDEKTLVATRVLAGNRLRWCFHFEDDRSFLVSPPAAPVFGTNLISKAQQYHFFDLIATDDVFASRHWRDYVRPDIDHRFASNTNWKYGTVKALLNRFAEEISTAYQGRVEQLLKKHFIQRPVYPSFTDSPNALNSSLDWIGSPSASRLMLIKGDAGAGKSVLTLVLVKELQRRFREDPNRYPSSFLIWFTNERPGLLDDLIALTLNDLGLSDFITPEAVRYLLKQGRLLFILDGFDEVSRALAENARQNVEEFSLDINRNTLGRLILTSRPSFIAQEDIFSDLKSGCEDDVPAEKELAPYTDDQMREWVIQNAPTAEVAWPPDRHWQRVWGAFTNNPDLRDVCRTPVFLRMLSEVLAKGRSVKSLYDLVEKFCLEMWERERGKRTLSLSDAQYYAYEAISVLAIEETRVDPRDVKVALELYLREYAPELVAGTGSEATTLVGDLAIGPVTYRAGVFVFVHEVFQAYFLARLLARSLLARRRVDDLWNRRIPDAVWRFLPGAVSEMAGATTTSQILLNDVVHPSRTGLVAWNLVKALRLTWRDVPRDIFAGKDLAAIVFESTDLSGMSFDNCVLVDVTFDRCSLRDSTFRNAKIKKVKFIECGEGAVFDVDERLDEDSEIRVVRSKESGEELYVGDDISRVLTELTRREIVRAQVPANLVAEAMLVIFASLFKADGRRLDYPEPFKIENRLRAWLRGFIVADAQARRLFRILGELVPELQHRGWIEKNRNRPRTLIPAERRLPVMLEAIRRRNVQGCDPALDAIIGDAQTQCDAVLSDLRN